MVRITFENVPESEQDQIVKYVQYQDDDNPWYVFYNKINKKYTITRPHWDIPEYCNSIEDVLKVVQLYYRYVR